jgi:serine/threonine protein kinase
MSIEAGVTLNGYRLIEPIADGGMGSVWKAKHPNLERFVAVKFIKPELLSAHRVRQLFLDEVRHLSQLRSPHVVQVLDSGLTDSQAPFMVTEYLPGVDLATHLELHGAMPPEFACRIGVDVLKALSEAHAMGIIHGDLKPSNIFLMEVQGQKQPVVKVLDFGVACLTEDGRDEESTLGNRIVRGSLQYMSPEQVTLGNLTPASDVYTFGATLYRLLTDQCVFLGEPQEQIRQKLSEAPPFVTPNMSTGSCPKVLEELVRACLQRLPEDRPSSAQALRKRLEHIQPQLLSTGTRNVESTAIDVSVPDWLQSGFSHTSPETLGDDGARSSGKLELQRTHDESQDLVRHLTTESDVPSLIEPPLALQSRSDSIELDVSRTVEQAAPSIEPTTSRLDLENLANETIENQPTVHSKLTTRRAVPSTVIVLGVVAFAALLILWGGLSDESEDSIPTPEVKPLSEMELTAKRLREAKALLAKLEDHEPRSRSAARKPVAKAVSDIVLTLPRGTIGRFLDANTKTKLCPQMVMSCRVSRNLNVEVRAPNHQARVISSDELRAHPSELKSVRLIKRQRKNNKK